MCRSVTSQTFPPRDQLRVLPACRSALPPPTPQPPPVATPTLGRELEEQLEDSERHVAQDGSPGRDAETTKEFPAEVSATGSPPGPPPPPSATTAFHHRPSGHPEDKQEITHGDKPIDPDRAWTEGNAKIVQDPPQDERARKEQAGTDQSEESGGTPRHGIVLQRVRRQGDQNRTEPEELKDNRWARSAGRRRARYRADAAAAAELLLANGGRRCRGAGR